MIRVFISYVRNDLEAARRLFSELEAIPGVKPWLDVECLLPGADWDNEIMNSIENSDLVIVLLSSSAVDKEGYIQKELRKILDLQTYRPPGRIFCVPARLNDCNPKHAELQKLQWADLFIDWNKGFKMIEKVILQRQRISLGIIPQHTPVALEDYVRIVGVLVTFERRTRTEGSLFHLIEGRNYIGAGNIEESKRPCDILIPEDSKLSSEHALIETHKGNYWIYDLASENGTFLDGQLLAPLRRTELPNYSLIHTGSINWQFIKVRAPT